MMMHTKSPFQRHVSTILHLYAGSKSGAMRVGSGEGDLFQTQNLICVLSEGLDSYPDAVSISSGEEYIIARQRDMTTGILLSWSVLQLC